VIYQILDSEDAEDLLTFCDDDGEFVIRHGGSRGRRLVTLARGEAAKLARKLLEWAEEQ
jgi:hypothetical protein